MRKTVAMLMIGLVCFSSFAILMPKAEALGASQGYLLAGGCGPGVVYKYVGGTDWDVISLELGYAVLCMIEYQGHIYAGTTSQYGGYNWYGGIGRVYRYDGGTTWTLVGDGMDNEVCSLAIYQGDLYAGTAWNGMKLYKYEGGSTWTQVINNVIWDGTRTLYVSHGYLMMGDIHYDRFGRWDGSAFHADLDGGGCCIYDFQDYNNYLYGSAYVGRLWQSPDAVSWSVALDYYDGNMWELEEFQSKLFMSYNNGELRAYDGTGDMRGNLVYTAPDGIISMTTDSSNLYFGTGGDAIGYGPENSGIANVYKYDGTSAVQISLDDQMNTGVQALIVVSPPVAEFSFSPSWPKASEIVTFDASNSTGGAGSLSQYLWDFGDGNVTAVTYPILSHSYATYGTFNVTLTVTNSLGANSTAWQLVNVRAPPTASFTYSPLDPGTGEVIGFDASSSTPNGGVITDYQWDFGDGNTTMTSDAIIGHSYGHSGTYTVTLTVFDSEGLNDTSPAQHVSVTTHDVAVTDVTPESNIIYQGRLTHAHINVTVENQGETPETFMVTVYADNDTTIIGDEYTVGSQLVADLLPGESRVLIFIWNTTEVRPCHTYVITAIADAVPHETDLADNTLSSSVLVKVRMVGDLNGDGKIDIQDIANAEAAFGSYLGPPLHPRWNPDVDMNNDNRIDIFDIAVICQLYGKTCL